MAKYDTQGFEPHYWERCYLFRCRKGECPYVTVCFAAQAKDHKEAKAFVESLGSRAEDKAKLTVTERINLEHAVRKHGISPGLEDAHARVQGCSAIQEPHSFRPQRTAVVHSLWDARWRHLPGRGRNRTWEHGQVRHLGARLGR